MGDGATGKPLLCYVLGQVMGRTSVLCDAVTGSAAPYWISVDAGVSILDYGLWFSCTKNVLSSNECALYKLSLIHI